MKRGGTSSPPHPPYELTRGGPSAPLRSLGLASTRSLAWRAILAAVVVAVVGGAEAPAFSDGQGRGAVGAPPVGIQQRPGTGGPYPRAPLEAFTCGEDQLLQNPLPLRPTALILAGDGRLYAPCEEIRMKHTVYHREVREATLLALGARSTVAEERWRTAQAIARMPQFMNVEMNTFSTGTSTFTAMASLEDNLGDLVSINAIAPACTTEVQLFNAMNPKRWQPGRLFHMLADQSADIQKEAAYAIGTRLSAGGRAEDLYTAAFNELKVCVLRQNVQTTNEVRGLLLEAIGLAAYATEAQRFAAEEFLVLQAQGPLPRLLGATRGLEALIRQNVRRPIRPETRARLRELAIHGQVAQPLINDPNTTIRILAVQALMLVGDTDILTIRRASLDADWQVRRLIASRLDLSNPDYAAIGEILAADSAFQVRYDLISAVSRHMTNTKSCEPLVPFLKDRSPTVVLRAVDVLPATCTDIDKVVPLLDEMVERLEKAQELVADVPTWHIPARALTALARVKPDLAKKRVAPAAKNAIWQVRVAAVGMAATLEDKETVERLAKDPVPNVQTAALEALFRTKNPAVVGCALSVLQTSSDFQALMTAARVLRGLPAEAKNDATETLLATLRGLTADASDMSRDPRVAILERLGETMIPERSTDLLPYTADFDDVVISAAVKAFTAVVGSPPPEVVNKRRRYPEQPLEAQLQPGNLPGGVTIYLDEGTIGLRLLTDVAPVTVARFVQAARNGRYDGKTLHRVVPNFVVQGGSEGANEYSGVLRRFMRDEVGPQARHIRGAVGISTRGPDTGDGQIFIDLVDLPRLDRHYTVFAYVESGMELVDKMLEGARIKTIK